FQRFAACFPPRRPIVASAFRPALDWRVLRLDWVGSVIPWVTYARTLGHSKTVAHWWDVGLAVVGSDGLGDVVGAFVGVDEFVVFEGFALGFEPVSGG